MNIRGLNNNAGGGGGDQGPSFGDRVKDYWNNTPLFVRFITTTTLLFYILSWITDYITLLANFPGLTIGELHLWALFTSVFISMSIFNLLFGFFAWIPDAIKLERENGTIKYMCTFFINSSIIQVIFTGFCYLISLKFESILKVPSSGLWPVILSEITMLCLANPEADLRMFLIPCPIKARFYPWALFGFFTVINGFRVIQFDILAGILYGYAWFYFLKAKVQLSDNCMIKIQNCFPFSKLSGLTGKNFYYLLF